MSSFLFEAFDILIDLMISGEHPPKRPQFVCETQVQSDVASYLIINNIGKRKAINLQVAGMIEYIPNNARHPIFGKNGNKSKTEFIRTIEAESAVPIQLEIPSECNIKEEFKIHLVIKFQVIRFFCIRRNYVYKEIIQNFRYSEKDTAQNSFNSEKDTTQKFRYSDIELF